MLSHHIYEVMDRLSVVHEIGTSREDDVCSGPVGLLVIADENELRKP